MLIQIFIQGKFIGYVSAHWFGTDLVPENCYNRIVHCSQVVNALKTLNKLLFLLKIEFQRIVGKTIHWLCLSQPRTWISNAICRGLFNLQWCNCTCCWYWWNCCPSLFKPFIALVNIWIHNLIAWLCYLSWQKVIYWVISFGLWCLTPLSIICQLYRGYQFYWWRKPKYRWKSQTCRKFSYWQTLSHNVVSIGIRTHDVSGDRHWLHK